MYKYLLESAGNINWMALFALITFVIVFTVSAVVAFRRNPAFIEKMANLPLDDSQSLNAEKNNHEK